MALATLVRGLLLLGGHGVAVERSWGTKSAARLDFLPRRQPMGAGIDNCDDGHRLPCVRLI